MELEPLHIEDRWKDRGAMYILAHPDDEALLFGSLTYLRDAGVPVSVVFLTAGELGIPRRIDGVDPDGMKKIRRKELTAALSSLGVTPVALDLGDLHMSLHEEDAIGIALAEVRKANPGVLFSFHPHEITPEFDHPDHIAAGNIARFIGASADVTYFYPGLPAVDRRPGLFLWTTARHVATHATELTESTRIRRNEYLARFHTSQFPPPEMPQWGEIFNRITYSRETGKHEEIYTRVR